ncbi:MAG: putative Holliday junction resolvase [Pseudohongiellaceae bacterium]|jgi:putative Holliday junction resolvase
MDYGRVRHGLAVSDGLGMASHPLLALQRKDPAQDLRHLKRVVDDRDIRRLVMGLPLNMDGSEGPMANEVRKFGDRLAIDLDLPIHYEDERLSTDEAETLLMERGLRPSERRKLRDSLAASVILQAVLDREG